MPSLADLIVRQLKQAGTRAIFGVPGGGSNLDVIVASGHERVPFVLMASETASALAAIAQAEMTGAPGACLTTLGPGAASVVNGVACAYLDRAPLLVFTDAHAASANGAFEHQQLDHCALFAPVTKWSSRLSPASAEQHIERAVAVALQEPSGPVHLDCPGETLATMPTGIGDHHKNDQPSTQPRATGARFAQLLTRAHKPLIVVGLGARRAGDAAAICGLLERRGLPAMVTYKAKGVVPDQHPCFAGVFTHASIERPMVVASDLIITVGLDPVELLPRQWTYTQPIVAVGRWPVVDRHVPFADQYVADIPAAVGEIERHLGDSHWEGDQVRAHVIRQQRAVDIPTDGLGAHRVVRIVAEQFAAQARVTVDAGAHMFAATMLWPAREPNGVLISNGLSTMGFALPAAIGAALLEPDRPVVALTGDGGLLMCAAELLTAAREKLRIITVVFNDAALSLIEIKQQLKGHPHAGVALGDVNWSAIAEGFGVAPFVAGTELELAQSLDAAARLRGPSLIDVRIDKSNYDAMLRAIRG